MFVQPSELDNPTKYHFIGNRDRQKFDRNTRTGIVPKDPINVTNNQDRGQKIETNEIHDLIQTTSNSTYLINYLFKFKIFND